jgi:hypothetical protein
MITKTSQLIVLFTLVVLVSGCDIRTRAGSPPNISALESKLQMKRSTSSDVLAEVGEPFGKGHAMYPFQPAPREMWSYYYEEGDMKDARRTIVYVFFDRDVYDGYIWFSSLPQ